MKNSPEIRRLIELLMDHNAERREDAEQYIEPHRSTITKAVDTLGLGSEEDVVRVLGYFDVNSIAVRGRDGPYRGRGIYPVASLMNHDCICNTRNIITGLHRH